MAEMIRTGTTCFVEPGCKFLGSTLKAIEETGMRATTGSWIWDHNGPDGQKCPDYFLPMTLDEALDITESNIKTWDRCADGRIRVFATIEGVGTCSDELTRGAKDIAERYGTFALMHKASSQEEVASELKATGHRPVEHMYEIGALGPNVYLNHMTAVESFEVDMLAETDAKVCQNPPAALKLAKGTTRMGKFLEMREKGVTVALGCDGVNSADHKDMFQAMFLAATLPKDSRLDPEVITAEEVIEMATIEGAKATGWEDDLGADRAGPQGRPDPARHRPPGMGAQLQSGLQPGLCGERRLRGHGDGRRQDPDGRPRTRHHGPRRSPRTLPRARPPADRARQRQADLALAGGVGTARHLPAQRPPPSRHARTCSTAVRLRWADPVQGVCTGGFPALPPDRDTDRGPSASALFVPLLSPRP